MSPPEAVEPSDASPALLGGLACGLIASLVLIVLALWWFYPGALHGSSDAPRLVTATPQLRVDPAADLAAYRAAISAFPIEAAMHAIAATGIPDWPRGAP